MPTRKTKISDFHAENLESRGLYRRAAQRWLDVMVMEITDEARLAARNHRERCIRFARMRQSHLADKAELGRENGKKQRHITSLKADVKVSLWAGKNH